VLSAFASAGIPERVVHAKGGGAHGYFEAAAGASQYSKAKVFEKAGKRTPVFARFSTVGGERGSADTARDPRGFAIKHYTEEGIWSDTRTDGGGQRDWGCEVTGALLLCLMAATHSRLCSTTVLRVLALIAGIWVRLTNCSTARRRINSGGAIAGGGEKVTHFFVFAAARCVLQTVGKSVGRNSFDRQRSSLPGSSGTMTSALDPWSLPSLWT
jgi:hypothetical protein